MNLSNSGQTLPAGKSITIVYNQTVNGPITAAQASSQIQFTSSAGTTLSDDPAAGGATDPTTTPLDLPDVTVAVSAATVAEDGSGTLTYTFTRDGATTQALAANFSVTGAATLNSSDYTLTNGTGSAFSFNTGAATGTITFAAGSSTATVIMSPTDDTAVEPDEAITFNVTTGTTYEIGTPGLASATITNDDTDVKVELLAGTSVSEDGAGNLVYTFTRTGVTTGSHTVNFSLTGTVDHTNDHAVSGTGVSFTPATGLGTVTFNAGELTKTMTVNPTADNTVEGDETVIATVTSGTAYNVTGTPAQGTITNDDSTVKLELLGATTAVEDGAGNLVYTFTRTGFLGNALAVSYQASGTATGFGAGTIDYAVTGGAAGSSFSGGGAGTGAGTLVFVSGQATATLTVDPTTDATTEPNETVILTLNANGAPATTGGYALGTPTAATGTILDDDTTVTVGVSPASVAEDGPARWSIPSRATASQPAR